MTPVLDRVKHSKGCLACWTVVMRHFKNCRIMIYRAPMSCSCHSSIPAVFLDGFSFGNKGVVQVAWSAEKVEGHPMFIVLLNLGWFGKWRRWLRLKNLSVEKEVDKLRECGGLWIPTKILKSVSNTHKKEISWKSKKYETPKVTEYRNISKEIFYRSWTKYVFIQKYLGSLETSVSLACLARKF